MVLGLRRLTCLGLLATAFGCGLTVSGAPDDSSAGGSSASGGASGSSASSSSSSGSITTADGGTTSSSGGTSSGNSAGDGGDGGVMPIPSCPPTTTCDVVPSASVVDVAVTSSALFWLESNGVGSVKTARVDGSGARVLVADEATPVAGLEANGQFVFWTAGGKLRRASAADGSGVVSLADIRGGCLRWTMAGARLLAADQATGNIVSVDPSNGAKTDVTVNATDPWGVAPLEPASATRVDFFYTNYDASSGRIRRGNGNLTTANPVLLSNQRGPRCMVTEGNTVWWANRDEGALIKSDLDMGNRGATVTSQTSISGVALDAVHVYWTSTFGIRRRLK